MTPRRLYIGSGSLVEQDNGQRRAADEARGGLGTGVLRKGAPHGLGLPLARHEIDKRGNRVEPGDRERDAVDERLEPGLGPDHATVADVERGLPREERPGVAVRPDPVQRQLELRELALVRVRGRPGAELAPDAVHLRAVRQPVEQVLLGELVIGVRVVRRHCADAWRVSASRMPASIIASARRAKYAGPDPDTAVTASM